MSPTQVSRDSSPLAKPHDLLVWLVLLQRNVGLGRLGWREVTVLNPVLISQMFLVQAVAFPRPVSYLPFPRLQLIRFVAGRCSCRCKRVDYSSCRLQFVRTMCQLSHARSVDFAFTGEWRMRTMVLQLGIRFRSLRTFR